LFGTSCFRLFISRLLQILLITNKFGQSQAVCYNRVSLYLLDINVICLNLTKSNLVTLSKLKSPYLSLSYFTKPNLTNIFLQALREFLETNPDPEILVLGNAVWSLYCKPNQTLSLEEYYIGLKRFVPVSKRLG
jgi:hypothetical protein